MSKRYEVDFCGLPHLTGPDEPRPVAVVWDRQGGAEVCRVVARSGESAASVDGRAVWIARCLDAAGTPPGGNGPRAA